MRTRTVGFWIAAAFASSFAARPADACSTEPDRDGVSPGITLGGAGWGKGTGGFVLGGEVSFFRLSNSEEHCGAPKIPDPDYKWIGGYVDAVYDFGLHATRVTLGPELGSNIVGIDAGIVVGSQNGRTITGVAIRPALTFGYFDMYVRYERLFDDPMGNNLIEVGFLIKWPHLAD
jgi:hypothetical protein